MQIEDGFNNQRREIRQCADDVIRWKRPGRIEDHRAWTLDVSPSGIGFMTSSDPGVRIGDRIHVRRLDGDIWSTLEGPIEVARVSQTSSPGVVVVGCRIGSSIDEQPW